MKELTHCMTSRIYEVNELLNAAITLALRKDGITHFSSASKQSENIKGIKPTLHK